MSHPRLVPPAPHVLAHVYMDYIRDGKPNGLTFRQYLRAINFTDPAADVDGMDDGVIVMMPAGGPALISVPQQPVIGPLKIIVLLADFPDLPGMRPPQEYEDLLFSDRVYPSGSLRDYYREVSGGRVDVSGTVHGWLRLPHTLDFYAAGTSGLRGVYPRNARRMAEDTVRAALDAGIEFPQVLDALGTGTVTGLFIVHAGRGGEELAPRDSGTAIWSHKWNLRIPLTVGEDLSAATYLTVPEDCRMGVCAHELGHLAFQWEDFYDPNGGDDGVQWAGSGRWDLMAGGSWNGDLGNRPAHPMALHKSQHGWIEVETVTTPGGVVLKPFTSVGGKVVKVISPAFGPSQFLLLENRLRTGFDDRLPGEGLLVWRVDLVREQDAPTRPALQLVQADGRQDLELSANLNQGDQGDPFPGATLRVTVKDTGLVSTSFPGSPRSGITLSDITLDSQTGVITLNIAFAEAGGSAASTPVSPPTVNVKAGPAARGATQISPLPDIGAVPAEPVQPLVAGLANLLRQPRIAPGELEPLVRQVTPTPMDLVRQALAMESRDSMKWSRRPLEGAQTEIMAEAALAGLFDLSSFEGRVFRSYKANFGIQWDMKGEFRGTFDFATQLIPRGEADYDYVPHPTDPLRFVRSTGEVIQPGRMITDGGSVPRVAWVIPDIDPITYIHAYLVHDWDFLRHHCHATYPRDFDMVNLTLAEGIYTLMRVGVVSTDWRKVELVYRAVSSFVGRGVWDRSWEPEECVVSLPAGGPIGAP